MMPFGLKQHTIDQINGIFSKFPTIEQVILYGSRAKGNFRNGSDIDLVLMGTNLTFAQLLQIENELDDLLLPYKMDISIYHQIENPELLEHINRVGKIFFEKQSKSGHPAEK